MFDQALIKQFLADNDINDYSIRDDGRVDIGSSATFSWVDWEMVGPSNARGVLPIRLGKVLGSVWVDKTFNITTLADWFPEECYEINIRNNQLTSLSGLTGNQTCLKYRFDGNRIADLSGIHKLIPHAATISLDTRYLKRNIIGLCMIAGLFDVNLCSPSQAEQYLKEIHKNKAGHFSDIAKNSYSSGYFAALVVTKYLGRGTKGAMAAQRELMDMDLDDYAGI